MKKFLMPLSDYNRIYQVAHGVLEGIASVERSCIFFASFGALIINKYYDTPARVVAGSFAFCIGGSSEIAFFGKERNAALVSDSSGFHMWVQTETHLLDFMAPLFPEAFAERRPQAVIPRKMLQKKLADEAREPSDLRVAGDFIGYPDPQLTQELIDNFFERAANTDLLQIAEAWFAGRRIKQSPSFAMVNDLGEVRRLSLPCTVATGSW